VRSNPFRIAKFFRVFLGEKKDFPLLRGSPHGPPLFHFLRNPIVTPRREDQGGYPPVVLRHRVRGGSWNPKCKKKSKLGPSSRRKSSLLPPLEISEKADSISLPPLLSAKLEFAVPLSLRFPGVEFLTPCLRRSRPSPTVRGVIMLRQGLSPKCPLGIETGHVFFSGGKQLSPRNPES